MQKFLDFLTNHTQVDPKHAAYYIQWVRKTYAFLRQNISADWSAGERDRALSHLAQHFEKWQAHDALPWGASKTGNDDELLARFLKKVLWRKLSYRCNLLEAIIQ